MKIHSGLSMETRMELWASEWLRYREDGYHAICTWSVAHDSYRLLVWEKDKQIARYFSEAEMLNAVVPEEIVKRNVATMVEKLKQ